MGTLVKEGEEDEEEEDHFTALSRYHRSLLETGREWLCARTLSQPRLSRIELKALGSLECQSKSDRQV